MKEDIDKEVNLNNELTSEIQELKHNCLDLEGEINQKQEYIDVVESEKQDADEVISDLQRRIEEY